MKESEYKFQSSSENIVTVTVTALCAWGFGFKAKAAHGSQVGVDNKKKWTLVCRSTKNTQNHAKQTGKYL